MPAPLPHHDIRDLIRAPEVASALATFAESEWTSRILFVRVLGALAVSVAGRHVRAATVNLGVDG